MQEQDHEIEDVFFGYTENHDEKSNNNNISYFELQTEEDETNGEENRSFWKKQEELLEGTLCRSSSLETRIRKATKESLKEIQMSENNICSCVKQMRLGLCRSCLMSEISNRLRGSGFDSSVCRSKWKRSSDIPSGEHRFIDVVEKSNSKAGEEIRVIVELNFKAEFEIARANEEYNRLVNRLPPVFVGKADRLSTVVKILCAAGKRCMKEKKMHVGPWRKHKYMQAKWLGTCERVAHVPTTPLVPVENGATTGGVIRRSGEPRASMLTVGFNDKLPNLYRTAVEVV